MLEVGVAVDADLRGGGGTLASLRLSLIWGLLKSLLLSSDSVWLLSFCSYSRVDIQIIFKLELCKPHTIIVSSHYSELQVSALSEAVTDWIMAVMNE